MTNETKDLDDSTPISPEVLRLYQKIRRVRSQDERKRLMLELAAAFVADHDPTDDTATDTFHAYMEDYEEARLRFQQAALRVARLALDCIDTYESVNDVTIDAPSLKRVH